MTDVKAIMGLLMYWGVLSLLYFFFLVPANLESVMTINATNVSAVEDVTSLQSGSWLDLLTLAGDAVPILIKWVIFLLVGFGLPAGTPLWFVWMFSIAVSSINIVIIYISIHEIADLIHG